MLSDYGNKPIRENRDDDPFSQTLWRYNSGGRLLSQEGRSRAMRGGAGNQLDNPASEKVVHNRLTQLNGIRWQYDAHGRTIEKDNAQVRWRYRCDGEYRLSEVLTGPRDRNKPRLRVSFRYDPPVPGSVDVYDWPGHFVDHGHGESYARIRQEVWQAGHHSVSGSGTATGIAPGFTFSIIIAPHFSDDGEYLLTSATYDFAENAYASGGTGDSRHNIHFTVLPSSVTYRTPPETPWPKTRGPQTAKVVGPKGESIRTDRYGRVKVKFHWDRLAKGDGTSSCWVRVSSAWAGQGFGGVQIPPVNDEVVVDFINGDPDRPLIIGRVYIEASMPPWALPAATQNRGTRWLDSRSSLPHGLLIPSRLFALHRQSAVPAFRWPHYGTSKSPGFPHHQ